MSKYGRLPDDFDSRMLEVCYKCSRKSERKDRDGGCTIKGKSCESWKNCRENHCYVADGSAVCNCQPPEEYRIKPAQAADTPPTEVVTPKEAGSMNIYHVAVFESLNDGSGNKTVDVVTDQQSIPAESKEAAIFLAGMAAGEAKVAVTPKAALEVKISYL